MHRQAVFAIASSSKAVLLSPKSRSAAKTIKCLQRDWTTTRRLSSHADEKGKQKQSDDDDDVFGERSGREVRKSLDSRSSWSRKRQSERTPLFYALSNGSTTSNPGLGTWVDGALMDAELQKDGKMRRLMELLITRASKMEILPVIETCGEIKSRLDDLQAVRSSEKPRLIPPKLAYVMLLKALALHGEVEACRHTIDEMVEAGYTPSMTELDWLLKAAINCDDVEEIGKTLQQIEEYPPQERRDEIEDDASLLPTSFTINWTAATYRHLLHYCQLTDNIEYALTLLASASQRSIREANKGFMGTFISKVLDRYTRDGILHLAYECRLPRLMVDLASWMHDGAAPRRLDNETWMTVLRRCADQDWWPGVSVAWEHAIQRGLLVPDEGLLLSVIQCAARAKQASFIVNALQYYQERLHVDAPSLREWHWMPLFEAQCWSHDFADALRTASDIAHSTQTSLKAEQMFALIRSARSSTGQLVQAYYAFLDVGRDEEAGGVSTEVMNALIRAANMAGVPEVALKLYAARHYVQEGRQTGTLPALPIPFRRLDDVRGAPDDEHRASGHHLLNELRADEQQSALEKPSGTASGLEPTLSTFNNLLDTAINLNSAELGQYIFDCINQHRLRADEKTYEGAIILAVMQPSYEDAFGLLEECKARNIRPTASSYKALAKRCYRESDERWTMIGREMMDEHSYFPGKELFAALVDGNWVSEHAAEQLHSR